MVTTVDNGSGSDCQQNPNPKGNAVRTQQQWTSSDRNQIRHQMLKRVRVDPDQSNWSSPFVVFLMNPFVKQWHVNHAVEKFHYFSILNL